MNGKIFDANRELEVRVQCTVVFKIKHRLKLKYFLGKVRGQQS